MTDLEIERMRLAACSVAALGNTTASVAQRIRPGHPYYSASYADVCRAVDREMALASVEMPPPVSQDWQVSHEHGPDYAPHHFAGGVESIERKGSLLVLKFANGGQVSIHHGVTYVAPEQH